MVKRQKANKEISEQGDVNSAETGSKVDFSRLPSLLTIRQVSGLFDIHPNTLRNWDKTGKLPAVRIGPRKDRRYEREIVQALYQKMHPEQKARLHNQLSPPASEQPVPYEGGKYVIDSGFSWQKLKLIFISRKFTVFIYSTALVAFSFLAIQTIFFTYIYTLQAEEPVQQRYTISAQPADVSGWENSKNAVNTETLSTAPLSAFSEKNSSVYRNIPVTHSTKSSTEETNTNITPDQSPGMSEGEIVIGKEIITPPVSAVFEAGGFQIPEALPEGTTLRNAELVISMAAHSYEGNEDVLAIQISGDSGQQWVPLDTISLFDSVSNNIHGDYWRYPLGDQLKEISDISSIRVRIIYNAVPGEEVAEAYIDGVFVDLNVEEPHPVSVEIEQSVDVSKKDIPVNEDAVVSVDVEEDGFFAFLGADKTQRTVKDVEVVAPDGETLSPTVEATIHKEGNTTTQDYVIQTKNFSQPGRYRVELTIEQEGQVEKVITNFTWGVLAFNPDQSLYQVGQEGLLSIGVLDEAGDMVCDADVTVTITNPFGQITVLTTVDGDITISEYCRYKGNFKGPDYYAAYTAAVAGTYHVKVEATYADGTHTLDDSFNAEDDPAYTIKRIGPTRVFPYIYQPMELVVYAKDNYEGDIIEVVPDVYELEILDDATVREVPRGDKTVKEIVWSRTIPAGQSLDLNYNFKTPEISPALYFVGPARVGDWDEGRQWQMAIDVTYMYLLAKNASAPSGWTDDTATFDNHYLRGAATFSSTGGGNATHTHAVASNTVNTESAAGGTTCSRRCGTVATAGHTHTSGNPTIGNANNDPAYYTFYVWKNNTGVPTEIPQNTFAFFDSNPSGSWTRFSSADDRLVKLDNSHTTGGSDTHTHSVTWQSLAASSGSINELDPLIGSDAAADGHTHTAPSPGTTASATSIPAYVTTLIYEQTNATAQAIPSNFIGLFDGDPGTGWNVISDGTTEDYYQRFIRGHATTEGTKAGSNTHTHTDTTSGASGAPSSSPSGSGGTGYAGGSHTHTITTSYNSADHTPPYVDFVIAQCDGCGVTTINLSGTAYQENESTAIDGSSTNKTVTLWVNGSATACGGSACTDEITTADGAWSITGITASSGDIITIFLDDEIEEGTTVFKSDGTTQTNLDIYQNAVIVRNDTGISITNTDLESGDREGGDSDVKFDVASSNLTVDSDFELHVWTGDTYDPGGTVTTQGTGGDIHVDNSATMYLDTATNTVAAEITIDASATLNVQQTTNINGTGVAVDVSGTLNHTAGTFTIGNSTDEDMRVNSGATVVLSGGTTAIKDLLDIDGGTVTITNTVNISNNLDMDGGTLNINTGADVNLTSAVSDFLVDGSSTIVNLNDGSVDAGRYFRWNTGATINLYGGSHHTGAYGGGTNGTWEMQVSGGLTFNMISGTNPDANGCNITASNILIYNGGTFTTNTVTGGTLCQGTSHTQRRFYDIETTAHSIYNLKILEDAEIHTSTTYTIPIANDFTIVSGKTFTANSKNMRVDGDWINNGTFTAGSGTVTLTNGSGGITGTSDTTFYNLTLDTGDFSSVDVTGTDDPIITNTLTFTNSTYLNIDSGRSVTLASSGTNTFGTSSGIVGSGTYIFKPSSGVDTGVSYASALTFRFDSSDNSQTLPADTWAPIVEIYGNNSSNTVTAAAGTYTFQQNISTIQEGTGATIFDMTTNDPTITLDKNLVIGANTTFQSTSDTLNLKGNFIKTGTFSAQSGTIVLNGTSPQTIDAGGGMTTGGEQFASLTLSNTSGTDPDSDPAIIFTNGSIDFTGNLTITSQGVYVRFEAGSNYHSYYRLDINGQATNGIYFRSSSSGSQYNFYFHDYSAQGYSIQYLNVKDANACSGVTLDVTDDTSTNAGNNDCWDWGPINISGTIYSDAGSSQYDCSADNLTVSIKVNGSGTYTGTCTAANGFYTVSNVDPSADTDVLTIFLDNETPNATTVVKIANQYADLSNIDLYQNNLIIRHEDAGAITNSDLDVYDSGSDSDVVFGVTAGDLTVASGSGLYVWGGDNFTPGGAVTTTATGSATGSAGDVVIAASGQLTMAAYALSIGGDLDNNGILSLSDNSTMTFTATGTGFTVSSGGTILENVVFNGSGGGWSFDAATTIDHDLTVTAGTLSGTSDINVDDNVTGNGTINLTGGTFKIMNGSNNFGGDSAWTFYTLMLDHSGAASYTTTAIGTGSITITHQLYIDQSYYTGCDCDRSHLLNAGSKTWILSGNGAGANSPYYAAGSSGAYGLVPATSTFRFTGTADSDIESDNYYNLELEPSGGSSPMYNLRYLNFDIDGDVVIGDGTNDITISGMTNDNNFDLEGNFSCAAGISTNTINTGVGTWHVAGNFDLTNCDSFTATTGHVLDMDGDGVTLTAAGHTLYNLQTSGSGAISFADALVVANDISIGGTTTVSTSSDVTINGGDLSGTGDFDASGGTVILVDDGTLHGSSADWTFNNLTLNQDPSCAAGCSSASCQDTTTMSGSGTLTVSGTLLSDTCSYFNGDDFYRSHAISPGSQTIILSGTGQPLQADLVYGTSTVRYTGTSATTVGYYTSAIFSSFYNLELQPTGGNPIYTLDSNFSSNAMEVYGNLTIGDGSNDFTFDSTTENADLTVYGNFTCTNGATNTVNTGTGNWTVSGNLDLSNCTLTATTGHTFSMDGSAKSVTLGSQTIYNFIIGGVSSITQVGAMDVDGTFDVTNGSSFTQAADNDLNVAGNFTLAAGTTFIPASGVGKLIFDGDLTYTDSTSPQQDVGTVEIGTSPDTTNLASDLTAKTLTVNDGDILYTNGYDLDIGTGGITIAADGGLGGGTLDVDDDVETDGTVMATDGKFDLQSGGTLANSGGSTVGSLLKFTMPTSIVDITSDLITAGTGSLYDLEIDDGGGTYSLTVDVEDPLDVDHDIIITNGALDTVSGENNSITVGGSWDNNDIFTARSGTVTFDGTSASAGTLTIDSTGATTDSFYDLTLNDGGEGDTFQLGSALDVDHDLTITGGTLDTKSGSNYGVTIARNWTNNDIFTANNSTVTADGNSQQTFSGNMTAAANSAFYNLTVTNAGSVDPDVIFSGSADATNNFVTNTANTQLQFNAGSTYTFNNIDFDGQATSTRVYLRSSSTGTQWNLVSNGTQSVSNTDVRDSDACGGDTVDATDGTNFDATNNDCWDFDTLTFSISDNSIGFGSLSAAAARWATGDENGTGTQPVVGTGAHELSVATNATNGYVISYYGTTLTSAVSDTISAATITGDGDGLPGSEQFALAASTTGDATITTAYDYSSNNYSFVPSTTTTIVSESGSTTTETIDVYYITNIASNTEAGDYTTSITYIVTATF